jgi:hypothetical protein
MKLNSDEKTCSKEMSSDGVDDVISKGYQDIGTVADVTIESHVPYGPLPTIRQVDILLQALNCLASHHEEYNIDVTEMGEMAQTALFFKMMYYPPAPPEQKFSIADALTKDASAREVKGLGAH